MLRERFSKVRAELWSLAEDLETLAENREPSDTDLRLVARSLRTVCCLMIRVIDSLP